MCEMCACCETEVLGALQDDILADPQNLLARHAQAFPLSVVLIKAAHVTIAGESAICGSYSMRRNPAAGY